MNEPFLCLVVCPLKVVVVPASEFIVRTPSIDSDLTKLLCTWIKRLRIIHERGVGRSLLQLTVRAGINLVDTSARNR